MEEEGIHQTEPLLLDLPSDQSECDPDDPAFAKTPIRDASVSEEDQASSSSDSSASQHFNDRGDKTYFHVWGDMLTCNEMFVLDTEAEAEDAANCVEGGEEDRDAPKPLSIDTSMPCPLIQFGPIPKRRGLVPRQRKTVEEAKEEPPPTAPSASHNHPADDNEATCDQQHRQAGEGEVLHDERCCDFSLVAAKNKARLRLEEKLRRREQKKLLRY